MGRLYYLTSLLLTILLMGAYLPSEAQAPGSPVYHEGEIYPTIIIGNQCWMTKNLNIGTMKTTTISNYNNNLVEKYCYNDLQSNCDTYGGLYPWSELMAHVNTPGAQGICPTGWHIPTQPECTTLVSQYPHYSRSDSLIQGGSSGFDALLAGYGNGEGGFLLKDLKGVLFTSTVENGSPQRLVISNTGPTSADDGNNTDAYSVRCVRNNLTSTIPFTVSLDAIDVSCYGGNNGAVLVTLSGVSNPCFIWSNGATTEDLYGVPTGTYSVSVTEAGTTITQSIFVNQPTDLIPQLSINNNITCFDGNDGSLQVSCSGGTPPYTYYWENGTTGSSTTGLSVGTYHVTVADYYNCEVSTSIYLPNPSIAFSFSTNITQPTCHNSNNGSIELIPNITGNYSYLWNNFQNVPNYYNMESGNYSVKITDLSTGNCLMKEFELLGPDPISIDGVVTQASGSSTNDGSIDATITGGTPPYTYSWSSGESTEDIALLAPGTYNVTVNDANSCAGYSTGFTITSPGITFGNTFTGNVSCYGESDGFIWANATNNCSGPLCALEYSITTGQTQATGYFINVSAGTYIVTVTDLQGGVGYSDPIVITEPDQLEIVDFDQVPGCSGMNITLQASGGVPPYEYSLDGISFQGSNVFTDMPAGSTTFYVKDGPTYGECIESTVRVVDSFTPISLQSNTTPITCNGGADGSVTISVNNGATPYTFAWQHDTNNLSNIAENLSAANYTVSVTDASSCTETLSLTLPNPPAIDVNLYGSNVTYANGSNGAISSSIVGGTAPYSYSWSNSETSSGILDLTANTYSVTVTDGNQCTAIEELEIIEEFQPISLTPSSTPVDCNGNQTGTAAINATGGTAPYSYLWSNGNTNNVNTNLSAGIYSVTVTDNFNMSETANVTVSEPIALQLSIDPQSTYNGFLISCYNCNDGHIQANVIGGTSPYAYNWSTQGTTAQQNNLNEGNYSVTITDSNGCQIPGSINLDAPNPLSVSIIASSDYSGYEIDCPGASNGEATALVNGGVAPYIYSWNTGATTESISQLSAGIYNVTVTDQNGAIATNSLNIEQPENMQLTFSATDNLCHNNSNGSLHVGVSGGVGPYSFSWNTGGTDNTIGGLIADTYTVTVTDQNNCIVTQSHPILHPTEISINTTITEASCANANNGAIDLEVSGGVAPYSYYWSTGAQLEDINNLQAGVYTVAIIDGNGCHHLSGNLSVGEPDAITPIFTINDLSNYQIADGSITTLMSGGVPPYSFNWSNGASTQHLSNLAQGVYTVTITDSNNCNHISSATIDLPAGIHVVGSITDVACFEGSDGSISTTVYGGTAPYLYQWSNGATTTSIANLSAGFYWVTVTDATQTIKVDSFEVIEPMAIDVNLLMTPVSCFGGNDGSLEVSVSGGTSPFQYSWSNYQYNSTNSNLEAGNYGVLVSDAMGCMKIAGGEVTEPNQIHVTNILNFATSIGATDGSSQLVVTGGTSPYTYFWSNGNTSNAHYALGAGTYYVVITDASNCTIWENFEILDDPDSIVVGCNNPLALNYNPNANYPDGSCIYIDNPPAWSINQTSISHSILLPHGSNIQIGGTPIEPGDYLGVFFDSAGIAKCGGFMLWENDTNALITVYGSTTLTSNDGFLVGEQFQWKIWDASDSIAYVATAVYDQNFLSTNLFHANGTSGIISLSANSSDIQDVPLAFGWSFFSTYIDPFDPDIAVVLSDVDSIISIVKNGDGNTYWPQFGVNLIGDMTIGEGYHINMTQPCVVSIVGLAVQPETIEIPIPEKWSLRGYLRQIPASIEALLSPIVNNITIVKDGSGNIYWPIYNVNNIVNMNPGQGYQFNMVAADTLVFPANFVNLAGSGSKNENLFSSGQQLLPTDNNMTVGIPVEAFDQLPAIGDRVLAYTSENELVGSSLFTGENMAITIWGNDELTEFKDGMEADQEFEIRIISVDGNQSILNIESWIEGNNQYQQNKISIAGSTKQIELGNIDGLEIMNMPNPFASSTTISFTSSSVQDIHIQVFDELGKLIQDFGSKEYTTGNHHLQFDANGNTSGLYLVRFSTNGKTFNHTMNLIK